MTKPNPKWKSAPYSCSGWTSPSVLSQMILERAFIDGGFELVARFGDDGLMIYTYRAIGDVGSENPPNPEKRE